MSKTPLHSSSPPSFRSNNLRSASFRHAFTSMSKMTVSRMRKDAAASTSLDLLLGHRTTPHETAGWRGSLKSWSDDFGTGNADCADDGTEYDEAREEDDILTMMLPGDRSRDVLFLPAIIAAPYAIPFFPSRQRKPCLNSWSSPAAYHRLFHSARVHGYLHCEAHLSPTVLQHSEWWVLPGTWPQRTAIEAIGLLQLDSERHDERLQLQGRQRHAEVLQWFHTDIHNGGYDAEVILLTMKMMIVCEVSSARQDHLSKAFPAHEHKDVCCCVHRPASVGRLRFGLGQNG